jgi:hypothetical protein
LSRAPVGLQSVFTYFFQRRARRPANPYRQPQAQAQVQMPVREGVKLLRFYLSAGNLQAGVFQFSSYFS